MKVCFAHQFRIYFVVCDSRDGEARCVQEIRIDNQHEQQSVPPPQMVEERRLRNVPSRSSEDQALL